MVLYILTCSPRVIWNDDTTHQISWNYIPFLKLTAKAPENGWLEYGSFHCGAFRPAYFQVRFLAVRFRVPVINQDFPWNRRRHRLTGRCSELRQAVEQYRRLGWKRELAVQCYLDLVDSFKKTQTLNVYQTAGWSPQKVVSMLFSKGILPNMALIYNKLPRMYGIIYLYTLAIVHGKCM